MFLFVTNGTEAAQKLIPEANCKPDFICHLAEIAVFCDGSVHDNSEQRKRDTIERDRDIVPVIPF
ncbi:MAG: hypothetical protein HC907_22605 [Richelia sp. SM1_7_0]|nr:hypothetical protein [Richelia sp. SM1_7_0]